MVISTLVLISMGFFTLPVSTALGMEDMERKAERDAMVDLQIVERGIRDKTVLDTMRKVPRHRFVPDDVAPMAYDDGPLPIGFGQTISQPYIVAYMTEALELDGHEVVLEIGTGSGYQAAVLAEIVKHVFSIEIVEPLANQARTTLHNLGYRNVTVREGDGYLGWPEAAPFDAIILTAAPDHVPQPLLNQLTIGGRLILPKGTYPQELKLVKRTPKGFEEKTLLPVAFVPMTGQAEKGSQP